MKKISNPNIAACKAPAASTKDLVKTRFRSMKNRENPTKNSDGNPFFVLSTILLSLFTFTPFFYSLENITLLTSLKKSVVMAFKNSRFIIVIVFINIVIGFLRSLIQANFLFRNIFGTLLISYINLIITASALFYYQSHDTIHIPPKR